MGWFEKQQKLEEKRVIADLEAELGKPLFITKPEEPQDEWIWIIGYKGTDKDMKCRDYQYELGKVFDMPKNEEIKECQSGFHLCIDLEDVFRFYDVKNGNRFFYVRALVRARDLGEYTNKLVAKSIEFLHELPPETIVRARVGSFSSAERRSLDYDNWTEDDINLAIKLGVREVHMERRIRQLEALGYSRPFATHIYYLGVYEAALAVGSQTDLSMDMKAMYIYNAINMGQSELARYRRR